MEFAIVISLSLSRHFWISLFYPMIDALCLIYAAKGIVRPISLCALDNTNTVECSAYLSHIKVQGVPINAILHFNYYLFKIAQITSEMTSWLKGMIP